MRLFASLLLLALGLCRRARRARAYDAHRDAPLLRRRRHHRARRARLSAGAADAASDHQSRRRDAAATQRRQSGSFSAEQPGRGDGPLRLSRQRALEGRGAARLGMGGAHRTRGISRPLCPATASPSNTTARRFSAGSAKPTARACRARSRRHCFASRARRAACAAPAAPTQACTRWGRWRTSISTRTWEPFRVREALNFHLRPAPVAVIDCDLRRRRLRRALQRHGAALPLPNPVASRAAGARARPRVVAARRARCRRACTRRRRRSSAATISRPSAPPSARRIRRCARSTGWMCRATPTRSSSRRRRARSCTIRCARWSAA